MISVQEALEIVRSKSHSFDGETVSFSETDGRKLAEDIHADRDFPPYNRAAMDGICIRFQDYHKGLKSFLIEAQQMAGEPRKSLEKNGSCLEIMTGASVPFEADTVVRYEDLVIENGAATIAEGVVLIEGQNIHKQGTDARVGDVLIKAGKELHSGDIGVLASVGKEMITVLRLPKVAIISTGDELVEVGEKPLPHQIRKSNTHTIQSELLGVGIKGDLFHFNDDFEGLKAGLINVANEYDVLLLSGGVSKGKKDFVPDVLEKIGVEKHFHRIAQRPGKPMWFGSNSDVTVFGFPGNPVSTLACFKLYFKAWLSDSTGKSCLAQHAILTETIEFKPLLTYHVPVALSFDKERMIATPLIGHGSGDLVNLSNADGFISLPPDQEIFSKGEIFPVFR